MFTYLLLRREHPSEDIVLYGKTQDCGIDIIHHAGDTPTLILCKCYRSNVSVGVIRKELTKLVDRIALEVITDSIEQVHLYVSPDITNDAARYLVIEQWRDDIRAGLKRRRDRPSHRQVETLRTWHPVIETVSAVTLTDRARVHPDLISEFFGVRKVVAPQRSIH